MATSPDSRRSPRRAFYGRVAIIGGLHVEGQLPAQLGQLTQELDRLGLAQRLEIDRSLPLAGGCGFVPQCAADLGCESIVQSVDHAPT